MSRRTNAEIQAERDQRRKLAESDFEEFVKLVQPKRLLGNIHRDVISWWTRQDAKNFQLLLLPRDHMKSALIGLRAAWEITRHPDVRILYISSTANLATKQLKFIKDILTSDTYRLYWPEMVLPEDALREKWTEKEISVDHPKRKAEYVRDPTVFTAGLTTNITGLHSDVNILDDVVVAGNAYTEEGREKVKDQYGALSSIAGTGSKVWAVGTRYHPNDLYATMMEMQKDIFDEEGNLTAREDMFEVFERQVESAGDGTGEFLWPRQQRSDGRWFGFDINILADKKAQYSNKLHYRAQYYNDPHDAESAPIQRDLFQYFDSNHLITKDGKWWLRDQRLNVVAAIDFAFTVNKTSDSTSIVVLGVDGVNNYYVLDVDRFKTDKISEYYSHILSMYQKWGFRKIRAEVSVGQAVIVKDLKENYIRPNGLALSVEEFRPSRWQGTKEERILATLEPKYSNRQIWHYKGGNIQLLEEELMLANPPHDDIKDALASAIDFAIPPTNHFRTTTIQSQTDYSFNSRFGGVS